MGWHDDEDEDAVDVRAVVWTVCVIAGMALLKWWWG